MYASQSVNATAAATATATNPIVLSHGYCSGSNPFLAYPSNWQGANYYNDPKYASFYLFFESFSILTNCNSHVFSLPVIHSII